MDNTLKKILQTIKECQIIHSKPDRTLVEKWNKSHFLTRFHRKQLFYGERIEKKHCLTHT